DDVRWADALKIGCAQAFALIPGTSRSGATIIGGMLFGLSRKAATEFSFFLAIPTLFAATGYEFFRNRALIGSGDLSMIAVGFVGYYLASLLDFIGLQYVTASLERLVLFLYPTMVVLLSLVLFRKRIGARTLLALALSYAGILLVFAHDLRFAGDEHALWFGG